MHEWQGYYADECIIVRWVKFILVWQYRQDLESLINITFYYERVKDKIFYYEQIID